MRYEALGRTGLLVSGLSFGASALGSVFRPVDETEGIRAVHAALDMGINYFDVAPAYGGTVAETVLGRRCGESPVIATISPPRPANSPIPNTMAATN